MLLMLEELQKINGHGIKGLGAILERKIFFFGLVQCTSRSVCLIHSIGHIPPGPRGRTNCGLLPRHPAVDIYFVAMHFHYPLSGPGYDQRLPCYMVYGGIHDRSNAVTLVTMVTFYSCLR